MPSFASSRVGDYRIIQPLGRGGMATVYRAAHVASGEQVAIKTVSAANERVVQSIRREVRALARLRHAGIVRIVDQGIHGGVPWYAMELIEGTTLGALCEHPTATRSGTGTAFDGTRGAWWTRTLEDAGREAPASPAPEHTGTRVGLERALTVARRLCASLAYMHGEGLVHGDLKPDNVILRAGDDPVIVDFGLASQCPGATHRERLDVRSSLAGTAAYMAPETVRGATVDARADLYALGCILYEMATGKKPFAGFTVAAVLRAHLDLTPPPPSHVARDLPGALDDLVMKLLEKDPRDRFGHADDVGRVLAELGAGSPVHSLPPVRDYLYRPRFIGRRATMESLAQELGRARGGRGSLLLIRGESGIGKTRLVNELGTLAARDGLTVLEGECASSGGRPFKPFLPPLERLVDRCLAQGGSDVEHVLASRAKLLAPYQPALRMLPGADAFEDPVPLPAEAARLRVIRGLAEVLTALAARERTLVILDDLQWADSLTLDLLHYLMRERYAETPLVVLATYRTEEAGEAVRALSGYENALVLDVGRLGEDDIGAIVTDMLASQASPQLGRYVARQSEGNPFFAAEYLRAAVDSGLLRRDSAGRWQVDESYVPRPEASDLFLPLPAVLRELVERRIADLSDDASRVLSAAAVMGREADLPSLVDAAGLGELSSFDAIDELVRRRVLEDTSEGRVRFTHDKLREVAYGTIEPSLRAALHRRAAETLEARAEGDPPYEALARHWQQAGVTHKAVEALDRAGARALERCAYKDAADAYEQALASSQPGDARRAEWERCLAEAVLGLGDLRQGQRRLLASLRLKGMPVASGAPRLVAGLVAEALRQLGHRLLPKERLERRNEREDLLRNTRTYQRLVETYWFENDVPRMLEAGLRALNLAELAGPSPELARAYATMCLAAGGVPIHALAERYATLAVRTAEQADDPSAHAYALFLNSVYRVGAAKWARVEADLTQATDICHRIGDSRFLGESLTVLAMAALYQGDFGRSDALFAEAGDYGVRFDNVQHRLWCAIGRAETQLRTANLAAAKAELERTRPLLELHPHTSEQLRVHGLRASVLLHEGDLEAAVRAAARAEGLIDGLRVPTAHYLLEGYAGVAEVRLAQMRRSRGRDGSSATRAARKAVGRARRFATFFRIGLPRATTLRGALHWLQNDRERAVAAWRSAARVAARLGMRHEEELARDTEAAHLRGDRRS